MLPSHVSEAAPAASADRLRLRAFSPVSFAAYDSVGRYAGTQGGSVSAQDPIPNSYYAEFGDGTYLGLPADGDMDIDFTEHAPGTLTFEVKHVAQGASKIARFEDVPVTASTRARFSVHDGQIEHAALEVDADGDGTAETSLSSEGVSPLAYAGIARRSFPGLGLSAPVARQMCAKFANVEHILRREHVWDAADDDADRSDTMPGEEPRTHALRKLGKVEQWILARLGNTTDEPPSEGVMITALQAETLLTIVERLRMLLD
jgi:hypothetical protein